MYTFILIMLMFISQAFAQTPPANPGMPASGPSLQTGAPAAAAPVCPECEKCKSCDRGKTEGYREDSFGTVMVGFQYANNWVPRKTTASYTQIVNRQWSFEGEYATSQRDVNIAGIDIGDMREDRYTLLAKYYIGNSFHVSFGGYMSDININGSGKLQDTNGNNVKRKFELENYGIAAAFGSRWQNSWGLTWGVDWFRVNVPIKDGKIARRSGDLNGDGQQDVNREFKLLRTFPTFTFFGVSVGYTF
jgi:hypothetical protein